MRRGVGGRLFGIVAGTVSSVANADAAVATKDAVECADARTAATTTAVAHKATATHSATMTRLISVSLPSARSHRSNASASGAPMEIAKIAIARNRRRLVIAAR